MKEKIIQALLNKFLTEANIKLSLPLILAGFISVTIYHSLQIRKIISCQEEIKNEIYKTGDDIQAQIWRNNLIIFDYGQQVLGTWVDRMAGTQKTMIDYLQASAKEKKLLERNVDFGAKHVIEKAEQLKREHQFLIPDTFQIKSKRLK
jgi:hypothetical protein